MRIIIDSLIAVMLVGVVAGAVLLHRNSQRDEQQVIEVQSALARLHEQAAYHTAVQSAIARQDTLLVHLNQAWFGDDLPTNALLDTDSPWIDLAPPGDMGLHPPDPVATSRAQAGFWYNPTMGVFRARVTPRSSEAQTLALYNQINATALSGFEQLPDPTRQPIAHVPGTTPAKQYASMANQAWSKAQPKPELQTDAITDPSRSKTQATAEPDALSANATSANQEAIDPASLPGIEESDDANLERQPVAEVVPTRPTLEK